MICDRDDVIDGNHYFSVALAFGVQADEAVSKLLNGHAVAVLLKEFGNRFTRGGAGGGAYGGAGGSSSGDSVAGAPPGRSPDTAGAGDARGCDSEVDKMQTLRSLAVRMKYAWARSWGCVLVIHAAMPHPLNTPFFVPQVLLLLLGPCISNHMPHIMAVLAAALRDAMSQTLKMQALCAWRVSDYLPSEPVTSHPKDYVKPTRFCTRDFTSYVDGTNSRLEHARYSYLSTLPFAAILPGVCQRAGGLWRRAAGSGRGTPAREGRAAGSRCVDGGARGGGSGELYRPPRWMFIGMVLY